MAKKHRKRNQAKKAYGRKPKKKHKNKQTNYEQLDRMYEEWEAYDDEVFEKMFAEWEAKKQNAEKQDAEKEDAEDE